MINSNWHPISYRFGDIAAYFSNFGHFSFLATVGGLGTTYDVHLGLIGKHVVDFLLVLIELFFARSYGWGATSENRSQIRDYAPTRSHWPKISGWRGRSPPLFLARIALYEWHTTLPLAVFTGINFVADFLQAKCDFRGKRLFCVFEPPLGDLGATYDDHLRLIGKRVGNFILVLFELFPLGITAEALRAIIGLKSAISLKRGPVDSKFQIEGVAPPPTILLLRKLD